jgi:hypothetical protein
MRRHGNTVRFVKVRRCEEMATETVLQQLIDERGRLVAEVEALRNKVAGLEIAIGLISGDPKPTSSPLASGKVRVSETIVNLLRESGESGLKPKALVELAAARGISLNRGSVYSLLNRMEHAGGIVHENTCYKLKELVNGSEGPVQVTALDKQWESNVRLSAAGCPSCIGLR